MHRLVRSGQSPQARNDRTVGTHRSPPGRPLGNWIAIRPSNSKGCLSGFSVSLFPWANRKNPTSGRFPVSSAGARSRTSPAGTCHPRSARLESRTISTSIEPGLQRNSISTPTIHSSRRTRSRSPSTIATTRAGLDCRRHDQLRGSVLEGPTDGFAVGWEEGKSEWRRCEYTHRHTAR